MGQHNICLSKFKCAKRYYRNWWCRTLNTSDTQIWMLGRIRDITTSDYFILFYIRTLCIQHNQKQMFWWKKNTLYEYNVTVNFRVASPLFLRLHQAPVFGCLTRPANSQLFFGNNWFLENISWVWSSGPLYKPFQNELRFFSVFFSFMYILRRRLQSACIILCIGRN